MGETMAAELGNKYWKRRESHGRDPIFENPDKLWDECEQYFDWVDENPLVEEKVFQYQGEIVRDNVTKMRAMTIGGLCVYLGISHDCWSNYRKKDDFIGVCRRVEEVIKYQKFTGAAADLLNPAIIARDLNLAKAPMPVYEFSFPEKGTPVEKAEALEKAVSEGSIPVDLAAQMIGVIKSGLEISELTELADRLAALELQLSKVTGED